MRAGEWDLIVLDWWLPGEDGLSVLRRFRQSGGVAPVLFLTARDAVTDRVRGLDGGADDYLCKPFSFDELLARIRALVRRRERLPELALAHGGVTIDLATQRAQRAGHTLDLTAKELALLTFFLRHPGQVLSRTRIYDHVWDENFDRLSNTLEVHVMELRRKLEAHGPRLIHTLRGRGYIFDALLADGGAHELDRSLLGSVPVVMALVLVGFSTVLYVSARIYLDRQVSDRLAAALAILAAAAEIHPDGVEWEPQERVLPLGQESGPERLRWMVFDDQGRRLDHSRNLVDAELTAAWVPRAGTARVAGPAGRSAGPVLAGAQRRLRPDAGSLSGSSVAAAREEPPNPRPSEVLHPILVLTACVPLDLDGGDARHPRLAPGHPERGNLGARGLALSPALATGTDADTRMVVSARIWSRRHWLVPGTGWDRRRAGRAGTSVQRAPVQAPRRLRETTAIQQRCLASVADAADGPDRTDRGCLEARTLRAKSIDAS